MSVKKGATHYVASSSDRFYYRQKNGKLIQILLDPYFDSGFVIRNFLEYDNKIIISSEKNGTVILNLLNDSFIKNDPVFGSINGITAICYNARFNQFIFGTTKGLVTVAKPPKIFSTLKDSLPMPVNGCNAVCDTKNQIYYYLSKLNLIAFKIGHPGYTNYDISPYLIDNKYANIDFFDKNTLIIYGHKHVFFDLTTRQLYQKAIFSAERESMLDKDLIIDTYTSEDNKITMFSTYKSGLFVRDDSRDTQYIFLGNKLFHSF